MYESRPFFKKEDFTKLNEHARSLDYTGQVNPVDGVEYPGISTDVPEWAQEWIRLKLNNITGRRLKINTCFFRLTTEDTPTAPHQAHTDTSMGQWTFILYMQTGPNDECGTSLVRHKTMGGLHQDPWTGAEWEVWERDCNTPDAWTIHQFFVMRENKAVIYPSKMMHRAEPIGGFGKGIEDGRLVLTAFLDPADGKV